MQWHIHIWRVNCNFMKYPMMNSSVYGHRRPRLRSAQRTLQSAQDAPPSQDFLFAPQGVPEWHSCRIATVREESCHPDRTGRARIAHFCFYVLYHNGEDVSQWECFIYGLPSLEYNFKCRYCLELTWLMLWCSGPLLTAGLSISPPCLGQGKACLIQKYEWFSSASSSITL